MSNKQTDNFQQMKKKKKTYQMKNCQCPENSRSHIVIQVNPKKNVNLLKQIMFTFQICKHRRSCQNSKDTKTIEMKIDSQKGKDV